MTSGRDHQAAACHLGMVPLSIMSGWTRPFVHMPSGGGSSPLGLVGHAHLSTWHLGAVPLSMVWLDKPTCTTCTSIFISVCNNYSQLLATGIYLTISFTCVRRLNLIQSGWVTRHPHQAVYACLVFIVSKYSCSPFTSGSPTSCSFLFE